MVTKAEVTEYIDAQFGNAEGTAIHTYWASGNRSGAVQQWMSPEVATILQKLIGEAKMVKRIAKNRSNS